MRSTSILGSLSTALFLLAGCAAPTGDGAVSEGEAVSSNCPSFPASLAVPAGNRPAFSLEGVGVQIYQCQASGTGFAWVFQAPRANLLDDSGEIEGTHFAGPTWRADDGSSVVGKKLAAATVDASAIPWLLLQATSHAGAGRMAKVTYIQRLSTTAGLAPASGCDAAHVGATAEVGYSAKYWFYEAGTNQCN